MKYLPRLKVLLDFNNLSIILPSTVTPDNFVSTKDEIYRLYHTMKTAYKSVYDKYLSDKISSYVIERNDNLQHDQTKMINSILNRKPRRIVLDRLSFVDDKGDYIFTNNPEIIEKEAVKHFQHQAGPPNEKDIRNLDSLPQDWKDHYDPTLQNIKEEWWNNLVEPITLMDLSSIFKKLNNNKAPGPSKITYEDIIHLYEDTLKILVTIFNACITLKVIPDNWKHALLFLILKPHDWNCKLTNTRPITLLETPRKLLVNIISTRLNHTLSKHPILQFNNKAGVLGQSTLESLMIIQHLIEHALGYLDDTTWFGSSQSQIEEKLSIANSFYDLNNIKVNMDKYKILTNDRSIKQSNIILTINNRPYEAPITFRNKGERILGLYINALDKHTQMIQKGKQIVMAHYNIMKNKKLTHHHIQYIINKIVIPKLEYIFQHTILNLKQCQSLMGPLKRLFKQRLNLPSNTADNIIYNHMFQSINNFFDIQMKSQLNILGALFNTPVLREIAIQKVYNTLSEIWYPTIPSNINTYIDHIAKPTYLTKALGLLNHYGFSINFTFDINILGGNTPIRDYMSDLSIADIQSLKAKNIIYMDQVVSSDGNYLLSWPDVKRNNNNNYSGPISAWYKKLTDNYVLSNNLRLIHPLNDVVCDISRTHKSPPTMPAITTPKSQWSIHWNNVQKQINLL
ncbi:uncharacterized protein OCT59_028159 [Rhizophagus irregularis]|uniref:uncharacterized protein n=1 Tax=Rhizophagus irregularis TaxID=588596 RepID=UPI00332A5DB6|nr:hypothetical protein OCT59_028159 [Rhizophagus irregularis]